MKYNMKNIFRVATFAVCGAMFIASCTDDWDDHYDAVTQTGTGGTTMAYLEAHASDFAEIIKAAGYDKKLSSSQVLTILAPQNDSFNKDELLRQIASGDKEEVVERFLENHILLYNVSMNNDEKTVSLLNEKKIHFGTLDDKQIDGVDVLQENVVCNNGIIHILKDDIAYKANVMEQLGDNYKKYLAENGLEDSNDIISLYSFLRLYDADSLDEHRSVEFGQDEYGNVVYSDSVMIRNNTILRSLNAYIYREDSSYWAIDPGVDAYQKLYNEAKTYFNFNDAYAEDVVRRDSMSRYFAQYNIIREFFFNANVNQADAVAETTKGDSLVTTTFSRWNWKHHNYKNPFQTGGILGNYQDKQECSNGYVFTWPAASTPAEDTDATGEESEITVSTDLPITVYDAFFTEQKIEANPSTLVPSAGRQRTNDEWTITTTSRQVYNGTSNDSVSNGYYKIEGVAPVSKPVVSFKLSNTLSGTYDIYIVMLPWNVDNPDVDPAAMIPVKFKSYLYEADEKNVIPYLNNSENVHNFTPTGYIVYDDPTRVDTIFVGTHTFKYCYQYTSASSSYLKLSLERSTSERTQGKFDNKYLLDFIYLVPHRDDVDPTQRFKRQEEATEETPETGRSEE